VRQWWQRRSLRVRLAAWYAVVGIGICAAYFTLVLATGVWRPTSRLHLWLALALGGPATMLLFALAGYVIAGRALAPVKEMVERTRRLSAKSLNERLPVVNPHDELGQLATVFNETLQQLENSFAELKRFTADVSHELRTPLTAIRAVGEVAYRERNPALLYDALGSILEEVQRMNQLIDRLLLLARADDDNLPVHLEAGPVRDMLMLQLVNAGLPAIFAKVERFDVLNVLRLRPIALFQRGSHRRRNLWRTHRGKPFSAGCRIAGPLRQPAIHPGQPFVHL